MRSVEESLQSYDPLAVNHALIAKRVHLIKGQERYSPA